MKFLADMGVSRGVVDWLLSAGYDAVHLSDQRLHKLSDLLIFKKAADEERIVLTFDLDFGEILAMSAGRVISVILFRLNNTSTDFVIGRLRVVFSDASTIVALKTGAIIVVEDGRYRLRRLPFA
jgi:predicted nuclease of predicted toxin-antitoxin system